MRKQVKELRALHKLGGIILEELEAGLGRLETAFSTDGDTEAVKSQNSTRSSPVRDKSMKALSGTWQSVREISEGAQLEPEAVGQVLAKLVRDGSHKLERQRAGKSFQYRKKV